MNTEVPEIMSLQAGEKLGAYEVLAKIGEGGMGEVYQARDIKLKRDVALKVLPAAFAHDPERMARFEREAQVLASLNHPNIAAIYGVEESNGTHALVMEFIDGESLQAMAKRVTSNNAVMSFEEAWQLCSQIADALEYAHDRNVIHRDLKPANVMVTPEGVVKLLDFGLAKALSPVAAASSNGSTEDSPTLTLALTNANVILGTAGYMAPEQAKGKQVDKRADIWAFGVVLYELLTGERLFRGEDTADTLAQVLTKQPDFEKAPPQTRLLLRECLEKDPKRRLRDIGDARRIIEIAQQMEGGLKAARDFSPAAEQELRASAAKGNRGRLVAQIAAAVFAITAIALAFIYLRRPPVEPGVPSQFSVSPPPALHYQSVAISPDGRYLALVVVTKGPRQLWLRAIGSLDAHLLPGTEDAARPFWSPDSQSIGFFAQGKLKRIDVQGGSPQIVCTASQNFAGGAWSKDGVILLGGLNNGLASVQASGGELTLLTTPNTSRRQLAHWVPQFLPDGRHYLYLAAGNPDDSAIYAGALNSKEVKLIRKGYSQARYANGFLMFVNDNILFAQRFDPDRLELSGEPVRIADQVGIADQWLLAPQFSSSDAGAVAFLLGSSTPVTELLWVDRHGKPAGRAGPPGEYLDPELSRDGKRIAFERKTNGRDRDIWLLDVDRNATARLTFDAANEYYPIWSPDGAKIAYGSDRDGAYNLFLKPSDGSGAEELLLKSKSSVAPYSWSTDGRTLMFRKQVAQNEIWHLPLVEPGKPQAFLSSKDFTQAYPELSPDGRWLLYGSTESGQYEVYVRGFPQSTGKWQISASGGLYGRWSRDGREIYFISGDQRLMAAPVKPGTSFEAGSPTELFEIDVLNGSRAVQGTKHQFDVAPDGRFLLNSPVSGADEGGSIAVVLNWAAGLK